jgi:hypothetical protein
MVGMSTVRGVVVTGAAASVVLDTGAIMTCRGACA